MRGREAAPLLLGTGLVVRRFRVARADVAWIRYVLEAHDGLGNLHGDGRGVIAIVTTTELAEALDAMLDDLGNEIAIAPVAGDEPASLV